MKKIMFNDKYGLTEAVLERRKTQTRRILNPTMLFERLNTYEGREKEDIVIGSVAAILMTLCYVGSVFAQYMIEFIK